MSKSVRYSLRFNRVSRGELPVYVRFCARGARM
jgi:hypothetical protein